MGGSYTIEFVQQLRLLIQFGSSNMQISLKVNDVDQKSKDDLEQAVAACQGKIML